MRKRKYLIGALTGVIGALVFSGVASAAVLSQSLKTTVNPAKAPKKTFVAVKSFRNDVDTTYDGVFSPFGTQTVLTFSKDIKFTPGNVAQCNLNTIRTVPEATADYAGLAFADRAALVDYMRTNLGPAIVTMHHVHHPEITVDGDTATGRWYLHDQVLSAELRFKLEGAAFYEDRYVRTPDGWKVAHTGYERTFEATYSLDDLPGLRITTPGPDVRER